MYKPVLLLMACITSSILLMNCCIAKCAFKVAYLLWCRDICHLLPAISFCRWCRVLALMCTACHGELMPCIRPRLGAWFGQHGRKQHPYYPPKPRIVTARKARPCKRLGSPKPQAWPTQSDVRIRSCQLDNTTASPSQTLVTLCSWTPKRLLVLQIL